MAAGRQRWRGRGWLVGAMALVVGLSGWAWSRRPTSSLMAYVQAPRAAQVSLTLSDQRPGPSAGPCPAWRMHLRIDPALRLPGPSWMMYEGNHAGYELHWLPEQATLQVMRAPNVLLGAARLPRPPSEVVFGRCGLRLQVRVNGDEVLSCIDPGGIVPLPTTWGFYANDAMGGGSDISLHDDRELLDAVEVQALDWTAIPTSAPAQWRKRPLLMTRMALLAEREHAGPALALATATVDAAGQQQTTHDALRTWLEWNYLRLALTPTPSETDPWPELDVATAKEQFETLTRLRPSPEQMGLFLALLDHVVAQAVDRPAERAPEAALAARHAWLDLARKTAAAALRLDASNNGTLPDHWRWQVRLLHHAAACLGGDAPDPLPAEAPPWVMLRWRMLAGGGTSGSALDQPDHQIPATDWDGNPIRPALDRLLAASEIEPLAATEATARLTTVVADFNQVIGTLPVSQQIELRAQTDKTVAGLLRKPVPEREAALIQALLALNGIGAADKAHERLYPKEARTRRTQDDPPLALAERDPLAYALDRLLVTRIIYAASARGDDQQRSSSGEDLLRNPTGLPLSLVNYTSLLSGRPEALERAWDFPGLSPVQAMAAAIALNEAVCNVQEAALSLQQRQSGPDLNADETTRRRQEMTERRAQVEGMWRLLDRLPCLTLPLHFAQPASRAARPDNVEGGTAHPLSVP